MYIVRTLILVSCLAVVGFAQGRATSSNIDTNYAQTDLKEISSRAGEMEGHKVAITADIISISADRRSLVVFDNNTKTLADVSLAQLGKSQRHALITDPIHRVSVFGRVEIKNGRALIKADQVMPLTTNLVASE